MLVCVCVRAPITCPNIYARLNSGCCLKQRRCQYLYTRHFPAVCTSHLQTAIKQVTLLQFSRYEGQIVAAFCVRRPPFLKTPPFRLHLIHNTNEETLANSTKTVFLEEMTHGKFLAKQYEQVYGAPRVPLGKIKFDSWPQDTNSREQNN